MSVIIICVTFTTHPTPHLPIASSPLVVCVADNELDGQTHPLSLDPSMVMAFPRFLPIQEMGRFHEDELSKPEVLCRCHTVMLFLTLHCPALAGLRRQQSSGKIGQKLEIAVEASDISSGLAT